MCGVVATMSWGAPLDQADEVRTAAALEAIAHRGPDGRRTWVADHRRVILGHVRLATRDLPGGAQPVTTADGQIVASVNGEIYDAADLRATLEGRGHRFRSRSDSELVVHAWAEWGTAMLPRLRGELAFVLWDARRRVLVAARDRFGIKPLAWAVYEGQLLVASRARALFALGVTARFDQEALLQSATLQYASPHATLFAGVHELGAGEVLVAPLDGGEAAMTIERYWDLDYPANRADESAPRDDRDVETCARSLRERFDDAVRERLTADVPVAFQLSGGLDSSAVLASAAHLGGGTLDAFTASFPGAIPSAGGYDEGALAQATADHLGARLHRVEVGDREVAETFAEAVVHAEGPCINAHAAAKVLLNRATRAAGFKVVLTGEGADEVLLGYAHFRGDLEGSAARVASSNGASAGLMLPGEHRLPLPAIERALGFVPTWLAAKASFGHHARGLLTADMQAAAAARDPGAALLASFDVPGQLTGRARVEQSAYLWTRLALEGYILRSLGDGLEMASGVEGRLPFLDHHVFTAARDLPVSLKIRRGVEKWIFRQAMRDRLPLAVVEREKHPFLGPPMGPRTFALLADVVASASFADQPLFDVGRTRALVDRVPTLSPGERKALDPVLFFALSVAILQARFSVHGMVAS